MRLPAIHGDKLHALLGNPKLPDSDARRIRDAVSQYEAWREQLLAVSGATSERIRELVALLNRYKLHLDLAVVFDSEEDFLYRQKGQLKLDNTVLEEFLPIFITNILGTELSKYGLSFGASSCFSSIYFDSSIVLSEPGGGLRLREKDQDFVIGRSLFIRSSLHGDFSESVTRQTTLAYVAVECKTNLDKTMFQEAAATALDLKTSIPSAKYYLVCEWLDMTPINSSVTAMDEVIVLRKARRLGSDIRSQFNHGENRKRLRDFYRDYLVQHPYSEEMFRRLIGHIFNLIAEGSEEDILQRGHF